MVNLSSRKLQALVLSAIVVSAFAGAFFAGGTPVQQAYSQSSSPSTYPTIKVTGDASTVIEANQATLIVNVQTSPGDLASVLDDREEKIEEITHALYDTGNNQFELTVGQKSISPYYSGYGVPAISNVTFNIYASVAIITDIDELSGLVSSLAEEGLGFESVYFDSSYPASLLQKQREIIGRLLDRNGTASDLSENPITVAVSLNIEPAPLTEALAEYDQKYMELLGVLDEFGITEDRIQQNSFNIYPYYSGYGHADTYNANTQIIITTTPFNIERMTNAVRHVDGAFVEAVYMSVSDAAIDSARAELTEQAIENAEDRAEEMAEGLDFEVTRILSIESTTGQTPSPYGGEVFYRGVKAVQPYYYQSITGDISVTVAVEFELREVEE